MLPTNRHIEKIVAGPAKNITIHNQLHVAYWTLITTIAIIHLPKIFF